MKRLTQLLAVGKGFPGRPKTEQRLKAQTEMTEYMVLLFFIGAMLAMAILLMGNMQANQLEAEKEKLNDAHMLALLRRTAESKLFTNEEGIFQHVKLTALLDQCDQLKAVFGSGWFADLVVFDGKKITGCKGSSLDCNHYSFCLRKGAKKALPLPVNVENRLGYVLNESVLLRTYPAVLSVGVYE